MRHTIESCKESASRFSTRNEWKKADSKSWQSAKHNGWSDECCAHMVPGKAGPKFGQRTYTTDVWVDRAVAKHGDKYDYSECGNYENSYSMMRIICREHGAFEQGASTHLQGIGCPRCGVIKQVAARTGRKCDKPASNRSTREVFIDKARAIHDDRYDYSNVIYTGNKDKVEIICPDHGSFWQIPNGHLEGKGCHRCAVTGPSKGEQAVFDYVRQFAGDARQSVIGLLDGEHELDIVIPSKMVAIEFNGLIWHSERYGKDRMYHQRKTDQALQAGYRLIHIWADEWRDKQDWCEAFLKMQLVGPDRVIGARKCLLKQIDSAEAGAFHKAYHLQGASGGEHLGFFNGDELVAVATVRGNELARWCVKFGLVVVGGLSRAMKWFGRDIVSYCDTAKHTGEGYGAAGFTLAKVGDCSYHYTDGRNRFNRVGMQKHKLAERGGIGETEKEMAESLGLYQIGGCRQLRFEYRHLPAGQS